jgi:hypothetical protein
MTREETQIWGPLLRRVRKLTSECVRQILHRDDTEMKANPKKAQSIGFRLISFKDALAKQRVGVLDAAALQEILHDTSHDPAAAEQELVMAWRLYTQDRELQIARGEFFLYSSFEEREAAERFSRAKEIIFDPTNIKGVASIESQIAATIKQDVLMDAIKWQAVEAWEIKYKNALRARYSATIPLEILDRQREEYVEGNFRRYKSEAEYKFRTYSFKRIYLAIRQMLEEHRDYWAQRTTEPYDDSALNHVLAFSIYDGYYGLGSLSRAWDLYLEQRISAHDYPREPFGTATEEERALNKEGKRKLPIACPFSQPNAREIIESHIRSIIREDILADTEKWVRQKRQYEEAKEREQQNRLQRMEEDILANTEKRELQKKEDEEAKERVQQNRLHSIERHRKSFVSKVRSMFGQQVLALISEADIHRYSVGVVDRRESEEELWYSILSQYDFDQNTKSCVYFIRQGNAIKIGFTDNLDRRLAQIRTSASMPCEIENAVYTHHAKKVERMLHKALADYNSHLEWFELPSRIEKMLFAAKSVEDVENVLVNISGEDSSDLAQEGDASATSRTRQLRLF